MLFRTFCVILNIMPFGQKKCRKYQIDGILTETLFFRYIKNEDLTLFVIQTYAPTSESYFVPVPNPFSR